MITHRIINWLLAFLIVGIYAGMSYIDGPSDHHAEHAQAQSLDDAQSTEAAAERFAKAAATLCGSENATARHLEDGSIQCLTKRGHKTIKVSL